jgi:hypothetical protein
MRPMYNRMTNLKSYTVRRRHSSFNAGEAESQTPSINRAITLWPLAGSIDSVPLPQPAESSA